MALMDKPDPVDAEQSTETDAVLALEEDGDVEAENNRPFWCLWFHSITVSAVKRPSFVWMKSANSVDTVMVRNYRGIYGTDVQFTDTEKSKASVKITKTKVLAEPMRSWSMFGSCRK